MGQVFLLVASTLVWLTQASSVFAAQEFAIDPTLQRSVVDQGIYQGENSPSVQIGATKSLFQTVVQPTFERQVLGETGESFLLSNTNMTWRALPGSAMILDGNGIETWFAARLHNPGDAAISRLLEARGFGIVAWFIVKDSGEVISHVDDLSKERSGRPIFDPVPVIPLQLNAGESAIVFLDLLSPVSAKWEFILWENSAFLQDRLEAMLLDGLYFGLVATLLLFCLVVFVNIREPVYLAFALFLAFSAATVFFAGGLHSQFLFSNYIGWGLVFLFLATGGVDLFAALLSIMLLRIHQVNRVLFRAWLVVIGLNLLNTGFAVFLGQPQLMRLTEPTDLITTSLVATVVEQAVFVWTLIAFWRSGPVAKFWFLVILSQSLVLIFWTVHSTNPELAAIDPKRLVQFVMVVCAVLLCVVLAYTYRLERNERLTAQDIGVENLRLASDIQQAKANFISTVSHDLHGPVRAIGFFAEALRGKTSEDGAVNVQRIEENVQTVTSLLDTLVRFSDVQTHEQLAITNVRLGQILYTLKNEFDPIARNRGLQLVVPSSELQVRTDAVALSQVLRNLIENALKYTDSGSVEVQVSEYDGGVCIAVVDTGRGISGKDLSRVFDEFYQVSKGSGDGVGLGLSIVARLTQLLDIKMNVKSKVGEGSQFELMIPREPTDQTDKRPITQAFATGISLSALVFDEAADELTKVAEYLDNWGVTLEVDLHSLEHCDLLLVPGTPEGIRRLNQINVGKKWVLLVGELSGFSVPGEHVIKLPSDVEPMRLRAVIQRILTEN